MLTPALQQVTHALTQSVMWIMTRVSQLLHVLIDRYIRNIWNEMTAKDEHVHIPNMHDSGVQKL
jgi:hypothetical protein